MSKRFLILMVLASLAIGCGKTRVMGLSERTELYNRNLKWGSLAAAGTLIADENRRTLLEKIGRRVGEAPIVDYSIVDVAMDPDDRKASVLVEFSFYGASNQTLGYRQEMQTWQWDSRKRDWYLLEARDLPTKRN